MAKIGLIGVIDGRYESSPKHYRLKDHGVKLIDLYEIHLKSGTLQLLYAKDWIPAGKEGINRTAKMRDALSVIPKTTVIGDDGKISAYGVGKVSYAINSGFKPYNNTRNPAHMYSNKYQLRSIGRVITA